MDNLPVVCTLSPEVLATRKAQLLPGLFRRAQQSERVADGYRLRFAPSGENFEAIVAAIESERQCCRFLRFDLTVEPGEGPLVLSLSGPPGTAEFIAALCE